MSKSAEPLIVKHNEVILKQYPSVEYLECLLDNTLSSKDMGVKVLAKVIGRLRFLYRQDKYLIQSLRRMLFNLTLTMLSVHGTQT